MKTDTIFYNAQHSPIGAFASFTLGCKGAKGGLGLERGGPANESIYIGYEDAKGQINALPFYKGSEDDAARFDVEGHGANVKKQVLNSFADKTIKRESSYAVDRWLAGDLQFAIYSPPRSVPDPRKVSEKTAKSHFIPALIAELTFDNTLSKKPRRCFFGYSGSDPYSAMRVLDSVLPKTYVGVGQGTSTAIIAKGDQMVSGQAFTMEEILSLDHPANQVFGLGGVAALLATVPAGEKKTFTFAVCFYRQGIVTGGLPCRYWYSRYFKNIEEVGVEAIRLAPQIRKWSKAADELLEKSKLSEDRKFMLAHAVRSYYGSTELLETQKGKLFWVVNEGEYRMMNTFDLTVDQLFFEMRHSPWTVANELEWFVNRFSYQDEVHFPGEYPKGHKGGISFTHDMGIANHIYPQGQSSYEKSGLHGCFSHMTHEELVNWVLCALVYVKKSGDTKWAKKYKKIFNQCFESMLRRDHPDKKQRTGIMRLDSSRCCGGSEITTYDSLDVSLGQARANLYIVVKCWGAYVGLEDFYNTMNDKKRSREARDQALKCASALVSAVDKDGMLPAVLGEGINSRIIPAIEGLVFPFELDLKESLSSKGDYGPMIEALSTHTKKVLKPGICQFKDGGWKISSTSDNSWLSKVYLAQFVAEVMGIQSKSDMTTSDQVHKQWLLGDKSNYFAWSDQMVNGVAMGSKYYPRGVTSILWLDA